MKGTGVPAGFPGPRAPEGGTSAHSSQDSPFVPLHRWCVCFQVPISMSHQEFPYLLLGKKRGQGSNRL